MKVQIDNLGKVSVTVEKDYWDITKCYDRLVIVEREGDCAYLSRKPVPRNILISNREYWIKLGFSPNSPYGLSQRFGYDPSIAISQKAITERFDDIQNQIDDIVHGGLTINVAFTPSSVTLDTESEVAINVTLNKEATSIRVLRNNVQVGETGTGTEHTVTTTVLPTTMSPIEFVVEAIVNGRTTTKTVQLTVGKKTPTLSWKKGGAVVTTDTVDLADSSHVYPTLYNPNESDGVSPIVYTSSKTNVATINSSGVITLLATGQTTIKAKFNGSDTYNAKETTYTLHVEDNLSPKDYYVGWATGDSSSFAGFAALTSEQLQSLATSYRKATNPSYNKTVSAAEATGTRQIFFLMWKQGSAPVSGSVTSGGITENLTAADFLDTSVFRAEHTDVVIDNTTYHVAGMRGAFDAGDVFVVNF